MMVNHHLGEAQQEVLGSSVDDSHSHSMMVLKGKRTKRQRPHSPLALSLVSYSSGFDGDSDDRVVMSPVTAATTSGGELVEEGGDEDMAANCLILLAQGGAPNPSPETAADAAKSPAPFCVYQCRTCDRCFPSFQALGGHRASHKKPRAGASLEEKRGAAAELRHGRLGEEKGGDGDRLTLRIGNRPSSSISATTAASNGNNSRSSRVHECAICGSEFASGQALGGHMRRHRVVMNKESRSVLSLDLNLPAPEESKFLKFASPEERTLVFSASSLVDCHY